jgi:hypothetical protein
VNFDMIDDNDYREGFLQGFRAICGTAQTLPVIPTQPATRVGRTLFQMGVLEGVAKGCQNEGIQLPTV